MRAAFMTPVYAHRATPRAQAVASVASKKSPGTTGAIALNRASARRSAPGVRSTTRPACASCVSPKAPRYTAPSASTSSARSAPRRRALHRPAGEPVAARVPGAEGVLDLDHQRRALSPYPRRERAAPTSTRRTQRPSRSWMCVRAGSARRIPTEGHVACRRRREGRPGHRRH